MAHTTLAILFVSVLVCVLLSTKNLKTVTLNKATGQFHPLRTCQNRISFELQYFLCVLRILICSAVLVHQSYNKKGLKRNREAALSPVIAMGKVSCFCSELLSQGMMTMTTQCPDEDFSEKNDLRNHVTSFKPFPSLLQQNS